MYSNTTYKHYSCNPHKSKCIFFVKAETVLLFFITSGVLFWSMPILNDIEFVPKDDVDALGTVRISLFFRV